MATTLTSLHQQAIMDTVNEFAQQSPKHAARIAKASELLLAGQVERIDGEVFRVWSQSDPLMSYTVTRTSCDCKAREFRSDRACKHMVAVRLYPHVEERAEREAAPDPAQFSPEQAKRLLFARWLAERNLIGEAA